MFNDSSASCLAIPVETIWHSCGKSLENNSHQCTNIARSRDILRSDELRAPHNGLRNEKHQVDFNNKILVDLNLRSRHDRKDFISVFVLIRLSAFAAG
jgi:hypothetical protein